MLLMQAQKVFATAAQEEQMWFLDWGSGSYHRAGSFRQLWLSFYPDLIGSVFWNEISPWLYDGTAITSTFTVGAPWWAKISLFYFCGSCILPESSGLVCGGSHPRHDVGGNVGVGVFSPTEAALSQTIPVQQISLHKGAAGWRGVERRLGYWDTIEACSM